MHSLRSLDVFFMPHDHISNMTDQYKLYRVTARTSFDDVKPFIEDIPVPLHHEVLLQIKAVSLNYRDLAVANGQYPFPVTPNVIPVSDCSAVVAKVGPLVTDLAVGDKVVVTFDGTNLYGQQKDWNGGHGGPVDGFLRQYATVQTSYVVKVPPTDLTFPELAALVCTGTTSWNALFGMNGTKPGDAVLVQGKIFHLSYIAWLIYQGTGGVSMTAALLAKAAGCTIIVTSSSDDKLERVRQMYGDDILTINYKKTPAWGKEAVKLNNGRGVDLVIENGGSGIIAESFDALRMGGTIAVIGFLSIAKQADMPDVAMLALGKGALVRGITVGPKSMLEDLVQFVTSRGLRPAIDKVFKFDDPLEAYKYMSSSNHIGKICIEM